MSRAAYEPQSGDIVWLELNPRTGHEQSGRRPCIILSDKLFTEKTGLAVICPITSKIKGLPFEIVLSQTKTAGAVLPIHPRTVDLAARYPKFVEKAPAKVLEKTRDYVRVIIGATS